MFQNITQSYTATDASIEIGIMLLGAFILWAMLAWLLKPSKQYTKKIITSATPGYTQKKTGKSTIVKPAHEAIIEDDLQTIEWVGPKIAKHLKKHGVMTFQDMLQEDVDGLEAILLEWGSRLSMHSPTTWPDQAKLAHEWKWKELEEYQEILNGGRKKK